MRIGAILIGAAALLVTACSTPASAPPSVYVMRHLQKAAADDPPLSDQGAALADEVADRLVGSGVKAVFATATRRAQETAAPLAARLRVPVTSYEPRDADALVSAVRAVNGSVLVVGHSNTVPEIVAKLGGARPAPIGEDEYGVIYVVQPGSDQVRQIRLGPTPPAEPND